MAVGKQRTDLKLSTGSEPALELAWWKRGISEPLHVETDDLLSHAKYVKAIVERCRQFSPVPFVVQPCSCSSGLSDQFFGVFFIL